MSQKSRDGDDSWPAAAADRVVTWARGLGPSAGDRRVLAIEGRSGSGKSSLAAAVADRLGAALIRMDDLYAGWDGLDQGVSALRDWVLAPLAEGRPAIWRRWDWAAGEYAEEHRVPDGRWLVVEGVGAGAPRSYLSGLVWLASPAPVRKQRALARDGDLYAPHWDRWAGHEQAFYTANPVHSQADLVLDN
ncbi:cytidylate kinase [Actinoplanes octamycinicus]|uniref:Cytidylate kinase n=1 Tax=Actinoplanes octamycinicus TaxID=135948 RepID=A0A7W7GXG6_9ACTN|nr:dephospho-CoA kinase [Actinoplanes octamycinicus]MBB4740076.1 cytidylate kinase [Actinoplanes octamycinicus]